MTSNSVHRYYLLVCLITLLVFPNNAQNNDQIATDFFQLKDYFNHSWGTDYNLRNGKKYYIIYFNTVGHPFFNSDQFSEGSLLINGVRYEDVLIKYDICNQQIIFQETNPKGQIEQLIITKEFIDEFTIDGKLFRRMSFPETGNRFFQIVRTGELSCYIFWKKNVIFDPTSYITKFTSQLGEIYLLISGQVHPIQNISSFIEIFGDQFKKEIKRYKRKHKISFRDVSDENIRQLVDYCLGLTENK